MEYASSLVPVDTINCDVPVYPNKILFAKDLVNYIINVLHGTDYQLDQVEYFRDINFNALDDAIKEGVSNINAIENDFLKNMSEIRTWDKGNYYSLADQIVKNCLNEGLETRKFLHLCVYVTFLAIEFSHRGLQNATNLASVIVYENLMGYDMLSGGWDSLHVTAKQMKETIDFKEIMMTAVTPDSSRTETADSELQETTSRSSSSDALSDDGLLNTETNDNIFSDGSQDTLISHVSDSENTSAFNTERCDRNLQLFNVTTENEHIVPIQDFISSDGREKGDAITQREDVNDPLNSIEVLEDEHLNQYCTIANGSITLYAYEYQRVVEDNKISTNCETPGANRY